ncbi:MAG: envelope stress response membrane protein PspB [Hyphomonas sp.]|jgi:phage shock protein B|nr:envelope stress response membrane protein PspB [Henriciella sp.]MBO6696556.1 envelope stress response membrane protein PspB [Henriciella sp.]MCH9751246.1 envelope stress response membrane protein PspB [Alphaproteobacteria bacterium]MCR9224082.1 envelope stress response membrane protein PspB [Hyphomonas sp.]
MEEEFVIAIVAIGAIFVVLPAMIFHYVTLWRKQKTLMPDDERMLEDLWRSARSIERRLETVEDLLDAQEEEEPARRRRPLSPSRFEE